MTARIVSVPPKLQLSVWSWLHDSCPPSSQSSDPDAHQWKNLSRKPFFEHESSEKFQAPDGVDPSSWCEILNSLPNGVLVLSRRLEPLYWTSKARSLCKRLRQNQEPNVVLPIVLAEFCQRFLREDGRVDQPLLMEYHSEGGDMIRAKVQWIHGESSACQPCLLVLLEDCPATLVEEQNLEQKKYELTDREAEVWILLRQEYSYQEIATLLNISMNTVKTHVKKVYAKRKNLGRTRSVWYSR
jgi:DNA-binding CsgD family transcriptional regulator